MGDGIFDRKRFLTGKSVRDEEPLPNWLTMAGDDPVRGVRFGHTPGSALFAAPGQRALIEELATSKTQLGIVMRKLATEGEGHAGSTWYSLYLCVVRAEAILQNKADKPGQPIMVRARAAVGAQDFDDPALHQLARSAAVPRCACQCVVCGRRIGLGTAGHQTHRRHDAETDSAQQYMQAHGGHVSIVCRGQSLDTRAIQAARCGFLAPMCCACNTGNQPFSHDDLHLVCVAHPTGMCVCLACM